ncbi:MAG: DEAD/DEAH box helicase [Spirochaetales bacterium]|nr:DEAD/DEAH box helicase [Spirochaetales bacterium]
MNNFDDMSIRPAILQALKKAGFDTPTPIQSSVIPFFMENDKDIIALAGTGTGKTAAFGIPLLEKLDYNLFAVQAVILSPVRELATQINEELEMLSGNMKGPDIFSVYGGMSISNQFRRLRNGVQVLCATPGRLRDIIEKKAIDFSQVKTFVIDEADRFFEMGFLEDLEFIMMNMPKEKQVCMFSATMPPAIQKLAQTFIREPEVFKVKGTNQSSVNITHSFVVAGRGHRYEVLRRVLDHCPEIYGIVFCRTKKETADISEMLHRDGYEIDCLHGDMQQLDRESVIRKFKTKKLRILAATDVAARGIDVDSLTHIINYSLPDDPETYIHRTGRTARAGKSGIAVSIIEKSDHKRIGFFEKKIGKSITRMNIPSADEICRNQLDFLSTSLETQGFNIDEFKNAYPDIYQKFSEMSRDDMLNYILAAEYGKIHEFYLNRKDLQEVSLVRDFNDRPSRGGRDSRGRDNSRGRDRDYGNRAGGGRREDSFAKGKRPFSDDRRSTGGSPRRESAGSNQAGYTRFFVTMGRKDNISPRDIIGFVNESTNVRNIPIGDIDIKDNFSFFEADSSYEKMIVEKCDGARFINKKIALEVAKKR